MMTTNLFVIANVKQLPPVPLVRGTGGSCNLVQEISFHIVKLS